MVYPLYFEKHLLLSVLVDMQFTCCFSCCNLSLINLSLNKFNISLVNEMGCGVVHVQLSSVKSKEGKKRGKISALNVSVNCYFYYSCVCSKCIHIYKIAIIVQKVVVEKENISL